MGKDFPFSLSELGHIDSTLWLCRLLPPQTNSEVISQHEEVTDLAKMFPSQFPLSNERGRLAEKTFFQACSELDDSWTVLYGVSWKHAVKGFIKQGEADFILMNPKIGILVAEVKGGETIRVRDGLWYSKPHTSGREIQIKDPSLQSAAGVRALRAFLKENLESDAKRRCSNAIGSLVVFPGHKQSGPMGINLPREMICDQSDIQTLSDSLVRAARHQRLRGSLSEADIVEVKEKLMLTLEIYGARYSEFKDTKDQLDRLTDIQLQTFTLLRRLNELTVLGGAGTGKTVLAFHRAKELANQGLETLYIVSSRHLATRLRSAIAGQPSFERLRIFSSGEFQELVLFYAFCELRLGSDPAQKLFTARQTDEYDKFEQWSELWQSFAQLAWEDVLQLARHAKNSRGQIHAILIDEAQLVPAPIALLAFELSEIDTPKYLFGDPNQDFRVGETNAWGQQRKSALSAFGSEDPEFLTINCRSTRQIAEFANSYALYESGPIGAEGPTPEIIVCDSAQWMTAIEMTINTWIVDFGLSPEQITLLVEDYRLFEDLWGNPQEKSQFLPLDNRITVHERFAIDWRSFLDFQFTRTEINLLTEAKDYLQKTSPRPRSVGFKTHYGSMNPLLAIGRHLPDQLIQTSIEAHRAQLKSMTLPVISALPIRDFVGLENDAVIVLNPVLDPGQGVENLRAELYAMTSRARVLLTLVSSEEVVQALHQV